MLTFPRTEASATATSSLSTGRWHTASMSWSRSPPTGRCCPTRWGALLAPILAGEAEYVTGSRFLEGGRSPNLPAFRERSIPLVNGLVRTLTGVALTDATCGYRAYALDLVRRANFNWRAPWLWTYSFEYYLYAKVLLDHRINWKEVPVTMRYPPKGHRYSKICPGRDWWAMLNPWIVARVDGKGFAPREIGEDRRMSRKVM